MLIATWLLFAGCAPATAILGEIGVDGAPADTGSVVGDTDSSSPPGGGPTDSDPTPDTSPDPDGDTSPDPDGDTSPDPDGDTSPDPDGDTSSDPDGDTSSDPDGDTSSDPDGDTSSDPDGDPTPVGPLRWEGTRSFDVRGDRDSGGCSATVTESGVDISADPVWASAAGACPSCSAVFRLSVSPETICGSIPIATQIFRGIEYRSGSSVRIHRIEQSYWGGWTRETLADGLYLGEYMLYQYDGNHYGRRFDVEGEARVHDGP